MTITVTSSVRSIGLVLAATLLTSGLLGCGKTDSSEPQSLSGPDWSVTAWGRGFEVYPVVDPLRAGEVATADIHVTRLADFAAVSEARVDLVLSGPAGEQVFTAEQSVRPGLFRIEVTPSEPGEADVLFRIHDASGTEEIRGGRVAIGNAERAGRLLRAPAPKGGTDRAEPLTFLKEEQWNSAFRTHWVREGSLARSVSGLAKVRPPAGGDRTVTAPLDGVVRPARPGEWPYKGLRVSRGAPLFRIDPRASSDRSLAALEAELEVLTLELETSRIRTERLTALLALEATSQREVEEARARTRSLEAQSEAAASDLEAARSARGVAGSRVGLLIEAPLSGLVAAVSATPGASVSAGEPLTRIVRTDSVWIEVALPPNDARWIAEGELRALILDDSESEPITLEDGLKLRSVAPELSHSTDTLAVLVEAPNAAGLALGSHGTAELLSSQEEPGIVVPASAVIDDGGVPVVYLQLSGETFARQRVDVIARQAERVLVERLLPGQRLVTLGGEAIRRASLMSSGAGHGHEH